MQHHAVDVCCVFGGITPIVLGETNIDEKTPDSFSNGAIRALDFAIQYEE
jgi:hypothetical protein